MTLMRNMGNAELAASLGEPEERVAAVATDIAAVSAADARLVTWQRMSSSEPLVCFAAHDQGRLNQD